MLGGNLLPKAISDLVQVLNFEEGHGAPLLDPFLIECVIMQGEDGFDVLPLTFLRCDTRSTFLRWACNKVVKDTKPLSFGQRLAFQCILGFSSWFGSSYTVKPILDPMKDINNVLRPGGTFMYLDL